MNARYVRVANRTVLSLFGVASRSSTAGSSAGDLTLGDIASLQSVRHDSHGREHVCSVILGYAKAKEYPAISSLLRLTRFKPSGVPRSGFLRILAVFQNKKYPELYRLPRRNSFRRYALQSANVCGLKPEAMKPGKASSESFLTLAN